VVKEVDLGELARVNQELEEIKARIEKIEALLTTPIQKAVICPDCGKPRI